jgi:hypothetical protein
MKAAVGEAANWKHDLHDGESVGRRVGWRTERRRNNEHCNARTAGRWSRRPLRNDGRVRRCFLAEPERRGRSDQGASGALAGSACRSDLGRLPTDADRSRPSPSRGAGSQRYSGALRAANRAAGPPGEPRHLLTLADLAREGIQVLDVQLEQMGEFQDRVPGLRERLAASARTGEEGMRAWRARPELDAWIPFESWYRAASSDTDFIPLPADLGAIRPTVIAMTRWAPRPTLAREFISFLRSPRAHDEFRRRGWL